MRVPLKVMHRRFEALDDILYNLGFFIDKTRFAAEAPPESVDAAAKYNYFPRNLTQSHANKTVPVETLQFVTGELKSLEKIVSKYYCITELSSLPEDSKEQMIEEIQGSEHMRYLRGPKVKAEVIRDVANSTNKGEAHITRLSAYLAERLTGMGIEMTANNVRDALKPASGTKWLPREAYHLVKHLPARVFAKRVQREKLTGKVDPKRWLYDAADKYQFRSVRYMMLAIAEKTGLNPTSIDSMMSYQTIPMKIYKCFQGWEKEFMKTGDIGDSYQYRVVPVEQFRQLLREHGTSHPTYQSLFQTISPEVGFTVETLREYISCRPPAPNVSMAAYRTAQSYILNNQKV
ncbi:MAG: hypothetical protein KJ601_03350 [Nanoarchaeota archaeon]|nr:hypothetical protein [Nanoarchaeota archaeon]MBU1704871.1 hypothetical protein [Nanoarchaeota archaeon]